MTSACPDLDMSLNKSKIKGSGPLSQAEHLNIRTLTIQAVSMTHGNPTMNSCPGPCFIPDGDGGDFWGRGTSTARGQVELANDYHHHHYHQLSNTEIVDVWLWIRLRSRTSHGVSSEAHTRAMP